MAVEVDHAIMSMKTLNGRFATILGFLLGCLSFVLPWTQTVVQPTFHPAALFTTQPLSLSTRTEPDQTIAVHLWQSEPIVGNCHSTQVVWGTDAIQVDFTTSRFFAQSLLIAEVIVYSTLIIKRQRETLGLSRSIVILADVLLCVAGILLFALLTPAVACGPGQIEVLIKQAYLMPFAILSALASVVLGVYALFAPFPKTPRVKFL